MFEFFKSAKNFSILVVLTQLCQVGVLTSCIQFFFARVFKNYYYVDVALSQEGIVVAVVTISLLCVVLVSSKLIWPNNDIIKGIAEVTYKLLVMALFMILFTGMVAVLGCGLVSNTLVWTSGVITVYKTYWTDSQLLRYCATELKNLDLTKKGLGIDVQKIVIEAQNSLDKCKILLQEEVARAKLARAAEQSAGNSYGAWIAWMLGIKKDTENNSWSASTWTWALTALAVAVAIGMAYAGIGAANSKANILEKQAGDLTRLARSNNSEMTEIVSITQNMNEGLEKVTQNVEVLMHVADEMQTDQLAIKQDIVEMRKSTNVFQRSMLNTVAMITRAAQEATNQIIVGSEVPLNTILGVGFSHGRLYVKIAQQIKWLEQEQEQEQKRDGIEIKSYVKLFDQGNSWQTEDVLFVNKQKFPGEGQAAGNLSGRTTSRLLDTDV